ncbi:hypothetical protein BaRGS_00013421, partial [Batillaria attramentaria]
LTPDEHAVSPLLPATSAGPPPPYERPGPSQRAPRAYSYGSDEEVDAVASRSAPLLQQGRAPIQHDRVVYDPPWDQINFEQVRPRPHATSESDEDNRHAQQRYSHAGTVPTTVSHQRYICRKVSKVPHPIPSHNTDTPIPPPTPSQYSEDVQLAADALIYREGRPADYTGHGRIL